MFMRQLSTPLRYFCFRSGGKFHIDLTLPVCFAALTTVLLLNVPGGVPIAGKDGFASSFNGMLQILTGFFVAALSAIFGAASRSLNQKLIGIDYFCSERDSPPTRREFLCSLFGYLSFVSFLMYIVTLIIGASLPLLKQLHFYNALRDVMLFFYVLLIWNIFFVTVYGLYYMVDRAHRADPVVKSGPVGED